MARLSAMMFLQYWPLGVWGVTFGTYIAANTGRAGTGIFSAGFVFYSTAAGAIGSLLSPVIIGFLSDRYFAAQHLISLLHAGCALAAWGMYQSQSEVAFFFWLAFYYQCFSPAASLTNKIGLRHLADSQAEYPLVRLFGTIGWIVAGLFVGFAWPLATGKSIEPTSVPFIVGVCGSVAMALYALTLPHSPPEEHTGVLQRRFIRDTTDLLRNKPLVAFLVVTMLACLPSMAYNNGCNLFLNRLHYEKPAALMTLGQLSETIVLAFSPLLIRRFGLRNLFMCGIAGWLARYGLLTIGSHFDLAAPVYIAIVLQGVCFVFVYIVGVMYVDRLVAGEHRGAAQGTFLLASAGLGNLFGAITCGYSQSIFLTPAGVTPPPYHWTAFWIIPMVFSAIALVAFKVLFPKNTRDRDVANSSP